MTVTNTDKPTFDTYPAWAAKNLGFNIGETQRPYDFSMRSVLSYIQAQPFFTQLSEALRQVGGEYRKKHKVDLLALPIDSSDLQVKSYKSVIDKSFRKNILNNTRFPAAPVDGWCDHTSIYENLNDLIRREIVCRYIDGLSTVADCIDGLAKKTGLTAVVERKERDSGYYAFHCYLYFEAEVSDFDGELRRKKMSVEIQLATQLQDTLRKLSHGAYEVERLRVAEKDDLWKWQPETVKFRTGFLGHTLQMLEGLLLSLRNDSQRINETASAVVTATDTGSSLPASIAEKD